MSAHPTQPPTIGFLGYGTVASTFSRAISQNGFPVVAYDVLLDRPASAHKLSQRAPTGTTFLPLPQMLARAEIILSTVTTDVALDVAKTCVQHLCVRHTYVDLNSTSAPVKVRIAQVIAASGATFCEGAIMEAVGGGPAAERIAPILREIGLNATFYSSELGKASTFKMLRSVFAKGLEALLIEFLVAGRRAGMQQELWEDVTGLLRTTPFEEVAANWVRTHPMTHERK